jgi:hypothetical protein
MKAKPADILEDLRGCLRVERDPPGVSLWIRPSGDGRFRCGYYGQPWTLEALDFLDRVELNQTDRDWIQGLLFGYRPEKIQEFIDRQKRKG